MIELHIIFSLLVSNISPDSSSCYELLKLKKNGSKILNKSFYLFLLIAFVFSISRNLNADSILLKNGKLIQGKVIDQDKSNVRIRTENEILTLKKTDLIKIRYESAKIKRKEVKSKNSVIQKEKEYKEKMDKGENEFETILWRSAVLPGWGQKNLGHNKKGTIYQVGFLLLAGYSLIQYNSFQRVEKDHIQAMKLAAITSPIVLQNMAAPPSEANLISAMTFSQLQASSNKRIEIFNKNNDAFKVLVGLYLLNLLDVGLLVYSARRNTSVGMLVLPDHYAIAFQYKF